MHKMQREARTIYRNIRIKMTIRVDQVVIEKMMTTMMTKKIAKRMTTMIIT